MCLGIGADMAPVPFWVYRAKMSVHDGGNSDACCANCKAHIGSSNITRTIHEGFGRYSGRALFTSAGEITRRLI